MRYYGDSARDEVGKGEKCRLNGPPHGAHDDQADVEVTGYPGDEVLFEVLALLPA